MKIVTIIGARPQFIKAAPFSRVFREKNTEILVHTGQHYDENMSDVFFRELGIPKPDYNLAVGSGNHGEQTAKMLMGIEEIILKEKPDGLLVYGDTNSTLAGALAASKLHIPVFHVEAGLRSYNMKMPEEQNRVLTDHISSLLLCPTDTAVENLRKEGIIKGVINTGDIMYDAVLYNYEMAKEFILPDEIEKMVDEPFYLSTIHRAENTDNPEKLRTIFRAFSKLQYPVIMPIHPRTRKIIGELRITPENVRLIEPIASKPMLKLTGMAQMVVTDSGGLQKESYFLKTPCTTLRDQTEWVETLKQGWNQLSPIDEESILMTINRSLDFVDEPQAKAFGDGKAAEKICEAVVSFVNHLKR